MAEQPFPTSRPTVTEFIGDSPRGIRFPVDSPDFHAAGCNSQCPLFPTSEPINHPFSISSITWNWNGSHPSGTAAEVKPGEITVTSHRGNDISKTGDENNPAVHIERSGNDVVKTANELTVEEKAEGSTTNNGNTNGETIQEEEEKEEVETKEEETKEDGDEKKDEEKQDEAHAGDKRKADEKADPAEEKKDGEKMDDAKKQKTSNGTAAPAKANGEKKKPGRPKGGANGEKAPKKEKKQPAVGRAARQTRSQAKAETE
ncbi:hypothetical protein EG329_001044 [Mollisiaceae sp. DMI_Dod_QoI]|nr:hypothetical protein EG329_001044 [Helotiales sp. DMI_Dod_QoI]